MKIIIIEDEKRTADQIIRLISRYDNSFEVLEVLDSVSSAIEWFSQKADRPDMLLADIQLTDGTSFDLFSQVNIELPVIFITAYNEYAIDAFRLNSIEYLLKPIDFSDLKRAFDKFRRLRELWQTTSAVSIPTASIINERCFKHRFLVRSGNSIRLVNTPDICYFYVDDGLVFARTHNEGKSVIDQSLTELAGVLDPETFFQLNRKVIASVNSIVKISDYFNRRVIVQLKPDNLEAVVSRERVAGFKQWLDR